MFTRNAGLSVRLPLFVTESEGVSIFVLHEELRHTQHVVFTDHVPRNCRAWPKRIPVRCRKRMRSNISVYAVIVILFSALSRPKYGFYSR